MAGRRLGEGQNPSQEMTDKIVVFSTCNSAAQAERIAHALVEQRLAACVSIVPGIRSIYHWKEQIEDAVEWLLVIKSRRDLMDELRAAIGKIHSFEVPELLALPVVDGSESYIAWLDRELRPIKDI
jgi:periplasmic divalent cation tolerance protein